MEPSLWKTPAHLILIKYHEFCLFFQLQLNSQLPPFLLIPRRPIPLTMTGPPIHHKTFFAYSVAVAIQKSSTRSLCIQELINLLGETVPYSRSSQYHSLLQSFGWFLNIGNKHLSVWAINPDKQEEIDALAQRVVRGDAIPSLDQEWKAVHKDPFTKQSIISRLIRYGVHISSKGFTVDTAGELLRKEFPEENIHLCCPLLDPERQYVLDDYNMKYTMKLYTMKEAILDTYLDEVQKRKVEVQRVMRNPEDFQALLGGHFKHGYHLVKEQDLKNIIIWDVDVKEHCEETEDQRKDRKLFIGQISLMIALAMKNGRSGILTFQQIKYFSNTHFNVQFPSGSSSLLKNIGGVCQSVSDTASRLLWTVRGESGPDKENQCPKKGFLRRLQQEEEETHASTRTLEPVPIEITQKPQFFKRFFPDVHDKLHLIDESWSKARNGVYFKHEISIEEDDLPPGGWYESTSKRPRRM